ncbi:MAG: hypothetical protein PVH48_01865 [Cyclobacteriaceae bacterium]
MKTGKSRDTKTCYESLGRIIGSLKQITTVEILNLFKEVIG